MGGRGKLERVHMGCYIRTVTAAMCAVTTAVRAVIASVCAATSRSRHHRSVACYFPPKTKKSGVCIRHPEQSEAI